MSLARCPQCGRALNTAECFACGYVDAKKQNPFGTKGQAKREVTTKDASQNSNPFGAPVKAGPKATAPKPITGVHQPLAQQANTMPAEPSAPRRAPMHKHEASREVVRGRPVSEVVKQTQDIHDEKTLQIDKHRQQVSREQVSDEATALISRPQLPQDPRSQNTRPQNAFSAFVRSPWVFVAIPTLAFLFFFSFSAFLFFRGGDDVLNAINASDDGARKAAKRLAALKKPSPREELLLGHAYAQLGKPRKALASYQRSFKRRASDERAIEYTLNALDNPTNLSTPVREALGALRDESLSERLIEKCESKTVNVRHNALNVLLLRGIDDEQARELRVKVALHDLASSLPSCAPYKEAGTVLKTYGRKSTIKSLKGISSKAKKCLAVDLDDIKRTLSTREVKE